MKNRVCGQLGGEDCGWGGRTTILRMSRRSCALLAILGGLVCPGPAFGALLVFDRLIANESPYYTDVAIDAAGNLCFAGFVVVEGVPRALVTKRSADGATELWSLQFGAGVDGQIAAGVDVDAQGNVYATGWTSDPNFPLRNPVQGTYGGGETDAFILKINPAGTTLVYSTFLGGADKEFANQIRVDASGNVHVAGTTFSPDFAASGSSRSGETDAFVVKLNPAGSQFTYRRLLGGSNSDLGNGLALDGVGNAYLIGSSASTNIPTLKPLQPENKGGLDVYLAALDAAGITTFATYLGGSAPDAGTGIAVDESGNIVLTGLTFSPDFPLARAFQTALKQGECPEGQVCGDGFVAKLNAARTGLEFSTFLGGNRQENETAITSAVGISFYGIDVDPADFIYVTGTSSSLDFPIVGGMQVEPRRGASDPFVVKFQPDGAVVYSCLVGPGQVSPGQFWRTVGSSLAVDTQGNAYVAGASLAPNLGPGAGSGPRGYIAKVYDLPVLPTTPMTLPGATPGSGSDFLRITDIRRLADLSSQLTFDVPTGSGYVVEASPDLKLWTPLFTQPPPGTGNDGGVRR